MENKIESILATYDIEGTITRVKPYIELITKIYGVI